MSYPYDRPIDAETFVEMLLIEATAHRAVRHPYLDRLIAGDLPDPAGALVDLCYQHLRYSSSFPRYLTSTIAQLGSALHRSVLLERLQEEAGRLPDEDLPALLEVGIDPSWVQGASHLELLERFLNATGLGADERAERAFCDDAAIWSEMFLQTCASGGAARAVGALGIGTEGVARHVHRRLGLAVDRHLDVSDREKVFFTLHATLGGARGQAFAAVAVELAANSSRRQALRYGMLMALSLRAAFFDAMLTRALAMSTAVSPGRTLRLVTSDPSALRAFEAPRARSTRASLLS